MLQASPQKIDFHHLLPHFSFQRSDAIFIGAIPARSGKRLGAKLAQLTPPAVQNVRVYLAGTGHFGHRCPQLQPPNCGFLKLPRELPSIQTHDTILQSLRDVSYSPVSISGSTPIDAHIQKFRDGKDFFVQFVHSGLIEIKGNAASARWLVREVALGPAKSGSGKSY